MGQQGRDVRGVRVTQMQLGIVLSTLTYACLPLADPAAQS